MTQCQGCLADLSRLIDGDLPGELRGSIEGHLAACETCSARSQALRALKHSVARLATKESPPIAVRARIEALRLDPPGKGRRWPGLTLGRREALLGALAVAAISAGIVVGGWRHTRALDRAHSTAQFLVDDHLKYAHRDDRSQLQTSSPTELQAWFEQQVELAARIPELHRGQLLGGRRCSVLGRPAALAFYEAPGAEGRAAEPVSLFIFEAQGEDWSAMEEVPGLRGKRLCRHHQQGVGLLIWEERGLVYAVAGALEAEELRALIGGPVE